MFPIIAILWLLSNSSLKRQPNPKGLSSFTPRLLFQHIPKALQSNSTILYLPYRQQEAVDSIDIERRNASIVLENMQFGHENSKSSLMYCHGDKPFVEKCKEANSVFAYVSITWNTAAIGNGSCASMGNGRSSRGYLDPYHYYLNLNKTVNFGSTKAVLKGLRLAKFSHINTLDGKNAWNTSGQAGDTRVYSNGTFQLVEGNTILLSAISVKWYQNLSYPSPVGEAPQNSNYFSGYFVGNIVDYASNDQWVRALDPYGTGYLLGVVRAAAFGPQQCYGTGTFWITLRGFPDLGEGTDNSIVVQNNTADIGAKVGPYRGSVPSDIDRARIFANLSVRIVSTTASTVIAGAIITTAVTIALPLASTASIPIPRNGASKMIRNAAFVARLREIRGFHTDSFNEYGNGLKPFLVKFPLPFGRQSDESQFKSKVEPQSLKEAWNYVVENATYITSFARQSSAEYSDDENTDNASVSDDVFKGCAFYTMVIVLSVLSVHAGIWLLTRKKPLEKQVPPHAWMVFIFSLVMEYVHTSSVLNALQYMRSHVGKGTGKPVLYVVAMLQLVIIGIGFVLFFFIIIFLAVNRLRLRNVNWIPRNRHPDPAMRRSAVVVGEYQAEDDNMFHGIFEGFYSGLSGPKVWIAAIEMLVTFVDTVAVAVIWNEFVCLAVLLGVHGILFLLFLTMGPFVDTIEGRLVTSIGFVDLILLLSEFVSTLGSYDTADRVDNVVIMLGTMSMAIGMMITLYCDVIPLSQTIWGWAQDWICGLLTKVGMMRQVEEETWSEWSVLTEVEILGLNGSGQSMGENDIDSQRERTHMSLFPAIRRSNIRAKAWVPPCGEGEYMVTESTNTQNMVTSEHEVSERPEWTRPGQTIDNFWSMQNGQHSLSNCSPAGTISSTEDSS